MIVQNNGICEWEPGQQYHSRCSVDVRMYPFDTQTCRLVFSAWTYTDDMLALKVSDDASETLLEVTESNVEWDIVDYRLYKDIEGYACCTEGFSLAVFELSLSRKPLFYIVNIVVPTIILAFLVLLVFGLPPESVEKMAMYLTLLLSYSVLILMVSDNVPRSSQGVPFIGNGWYRTV